MLRMLKKDLSSSLCEDDGVFKEAGDGERTDAARDGSEERTYLRAGGVGVAGERSARFGGAGVY